MTQTPQESVVRGEGGRFTSTLSEDVIVLVERALLVGATLEGAAGYAGVSKRQLFRWLAEGRRSADEGSLAVRLVERVDAALSQMEVGLVTAIRTAGRESWQANAWILERRFPQRYGRKLQADLSITATSDDPRIVALHEAGFQGDASLLTEEDIETLLTIMAKAIPQPPAEGLLIERGRNGDA